jgi:MFS family permease
MWCVVFFFASAGASAAYLTVSEIFPMETRAMAIAFFYAVGTGLGGIIGPILFGKFIEEGRSQVVFGYYLGAGLMIAAGIVAAFLAVNAEKRSLEDIAEPLTAQEAEQGTDGGKRDDREIDLRDREKVSAGGGSDWDDDDLEANRRAGTTSSLRRYH